MPHKRFTNEQIAFALRQAAARRSRRKPDLRRKRIPQVPTILRRHLAHIHELAKPSRRLQNALLDLVRASGIQPESPARAP